MGGITVEVAITPLVFDDRRSTASGAVGIPFGATTGVPPVSPGLVQISQYFWISNHGHYCMLQNLCLEFSVIPAFQ